LGHDTRSSGWYNGSRRSGLATHTKVVDPLWDATDGSEPDKESRIVTNGREYDNRAVYQIRVKGNLDDKWSDWFDDLTIVPQANNETLLTGSVVDQAALHGLLAKIRDLGLPLLSISQVEDDPSA
jgi:hypothetical protein